MAEGEEEIERIDGETESEARGAEAYPDSVEAANAEGEAGVGRSSEEMTIEDFHKLMKDLETEISELNKELQALRSGEYNDILSAAEINQQIADIQESLGSIEGLYGEMKQAFIDAFGLSAWDALMLVPVGGWIAGGLRAAWRVYKIYKFWNKLKKYGHSLRRAIERIRGRRRRRKEKRCPLDAAPTSPLSMPSGVPIKEDPFFILPGIISLAVASNYQGKLGYKGPYGYNRASDIDATLRRTEDGRLELMDGECFPVFFNNPTPNMGHWERGDNVRPLFLQAGRNRTYILKDGRLRTLFAKSPDGLWRIAEISDRNGNRHVFTRAADGVLTAVDTPERLRLEFLNDNQGLRIQVDLLAPSGDRKTVLRYEYDNDQNLTLAECVYGDLIEYGYDAERNLVRMERNRLFQASHRFDNSGRVVKYETNGYSNNATFVYDGERRITTYLPNNDPEKLVKYYYNEDGNVYAKINALGNITRTVENETGEVEREVDGEGNVTSYQYDIDGNVEAVIDGEGRRTTYVWDEDSNLEMVIDPAGNSWNYHHDERGNLVAHVDPLGFRIDISNDEQGQPIGMMRHDGLIRRSTYDNRLRLVSVTDFNDAITRYTHDDFGRILTIQEGDEVTFRFEYQDQTGWDFWRPSKVIRADGGITAYKASGDRLGLTVVGNDERAATYRFDAFGNVLSIQDARGGRLQLDYDLDQQLTSVTNQTGRIWRFERDGANRVIAETDFDGQRFEYAYDAANRTIETKRVDGGYTLFAYDRSNRLVREDVFEKERSAPDTLALSYDDRGELIRSSNKSATVDLELDAAGRVVAETANGWRIESDLDCCSYRTERRVLPVSGGAGAPPVHAPDYLREMWHLIETADKPEAGAPVQTVQYAYDPIGLLKELRIGEHQPLSIAQDPYGRQRMARSASGFFLDQTFDQLKQLRHQRAGREFPVSIAYPTSEPVDRTYAWNKHLEPIAIKDKLWNGVTYGYDSNGQLAETTFGDAGRERFHYDSALNVAASTVIPAHEVASRIGDPAMLGPAAVSANWSTSPGGRVLGSLGPNGETVTLRYDERGRVVEKLVERNGFRPRTWRFEWDGRDRLVRTITPDLDRWAYAYDGFGRRLSKQQQIPSPTRHEPSRHSEGVRVEYLWDGDVPVWEMRGDQRTDWHFEPDTFRPMAREKEGSLDYVVTDHLGTPREMFRENGELSWAAEYTSWGTVRRLWQAANDDRPPSVAGDPGGGGKVPVNSPTAFATSEAVSGHRITIQQFAGTQANPKSDSFTCPIRFQGQWADEESGLYYNRYRYYDPECAQYLSNDPIGLEGGSNQHRYAYDPNTEIDPRGLARVPYGSTALSRAVIAKRIKNGDLNAFGTNYAAAECTRKGCKRIKVMRNTPHGMHSEQNLVAWAVANKCKITKMYSEREPCSDNSAGCKSLLNMMGVPYDYSFSAFERNLLQQYLDKLGK